MVVLSISASPAGRSQWWAKVRHPPLSNSPPALDIGGDLVLPGLVDGHMHLDKTLTGLPWMGHAAGPTRMSRIETDKTILPHLPLSTEERAGNLIRECVTRGTTHLRSHVDIDLESGLAKLDGVLAAREHYRDRVTVQIVAFPQSGVMRERHRQERGCRIRDERHRQERGFCPPVAESPMPHPAPAHKSFSDRPRVR